MSRKAISEWRERMAMHSPRRKSHRCQNQNRDQQRLIDRRSLRSVSDRGSNARVPVSNAAGPLRGPAVPMYSHQRLVERSRSRSRPYASTTETWISAAKCARSCRAPRSSRAASSPKNRSDRTPGRGRRCSGRSGSSRRILGPPRR